MVCQKEVQAKILSSCMIIGWRAVWPAENLYEEVEPVAVLEARVSDAGRDFLVKFPDAEEDSWVRIILPALCHCLYCPRLSWTCFLLINTVVLPIKH